LPGLRRDNWCGLHATPRASDLDEGQLLFSQGDTAELSYLVLIGQVRLFRLSPEGTE